MSAQHDWQPIETVPKDGTTVLVWFRLRVGVWAVEWSEDLGWCVNDNKHDLMPLRAWTRRWSGPWLPRRL